MNRFDYDLGWVNKVEAAHKPNSVLDPAVLDQVTIIHLWVAVTRYLLRPTRKLERAVLKHFPIWSCTGWGLPSFFGHPKNWCALTAPFHPYQNKPPHCDALFLAVYSLLHLPSRHRDSTLWSTLPFGVRTFLQMDTSIQRSFELLRPNHLTANYANSTNESEKRNPCLTIA